ncbi:MAG: ABC transporter substrate-binding protein, partial [Flavobacteriales bacterium]|nr:ABC transporter substrate-binding protein [Flavobacteriales bacterium]
MSNFPLSIKDQMGRSYDAENPPLRIISLVPSITELLYDLGLQNEVVGLTKFCIHPKSWSNSKVKIGGTKKLNHKRISELKPDLIIGNKEENTQEDIETLQKNYKVFMTDVNNFKDAIEMIDLIGLICDRQKESDQLN